MPWISVTIELLQERAGDYVQPLLRPPHLKFPLSVSVEALGSRWLGTADSEVHRPPVNSRFHNADPQAEEAQGQREAEGFRVRRRQGPLDRAAAIRPQGDHKRGARSGGQLARPTGLPPAAIPFGESQSGVCGQPVACPTLRSGQPTDWRQDGLWRRRPITERRV